MYSRQGQFLPAEAESKKVLLYIATTQVFVTGCIALSQGLKKFHPQAVISATLFDVELLYALLSHSIRYK